MGCRRAPERHHNYIGHHGAVPLIRAKEKLDRGIGWKHRHFFDPGIERKPEALQFSMIALSLVSIITEDFIKTRGRKQGHWEWFYICSSSLMFETTSWIRAQSWGHEQISIGSVFPGNFSLRSISLYHWGHHLAGSVSQMCFEHVFSSNRLATNEDHDYGNRCFSSSVFSSKVTIPNFVPNSHAISLLKVWTQADAHRCFSKLIFYTCMPFAFFFFLRNNEIWRLV